ncbi:MAG: hypothetical protein ACRDOI_17030 [Trebonia sp.]
MTDYQAQLTARKIMEDTGLSARELAEMDMDAYARATGRPAPAQAALQALGAQKAPAALPDAAFTQQAVPEPQGQTLEELALTDDDAWLQWRQQRGQEYGNGILGAHGLWADAAKAKAGRSAMAGNRNTVEAPRIGRAFINHDDRLVLLRQL